MTVDKRFAVDLSTPIPQFADLGSVHFVGVGGAGMSAVARLMLARGVPVTGSDAVDVPVLGQLRAQGAQVEVGFDPGRLATTRTVVVGSAIRTDNPEVLHAKERGLLILHRSQALAVLMAGQSCVAVAGTNGKSTTSAMLVEVLRSAATDPSYAVGATLVATGANAGCGTGDVMVVEADESDGSFLAYAPLVSVVTSVQPDHLDFYGTAAGVEAAFQAFVAKLSTVGTLVACADDVGSQRIAERHLASGGRVSWYGHQPGSNVRMLQCTPGANGQNIELAYQADATGPGSANQASEDGQRVRVVLPALGLHNAQNAAGAVAAAVALGVDFETAAAGLANFKGVARRFENRGCAANVRVFDDYGHNPAKVAAAVDSARLAAGDAKVHAVFQPHLFSRTRDFADEFGAALAGCDTLVVTGIYPAREEPIPGVTGELVVQAVPAGACTVHWEPELGEVAKLLVAVAKPGDVIVTIGAGDVNSVIPEVLARLRQRTGEGGEG